MDELEKRIFQLEAGHAAIERIEGKVDQLVETAMAVRSLEGAMLSSKSLQDKAFEKIDLLREDFTGLRHTVHTRWAMARGIALAAMFFLTLVQGISAYVVTSFSHTSQVDHERIIRLQEIVKDPKRLHDHSYKTPPTMGMTMGGKPSWAPSIQPTK